MRWCSRHHVAVSGVRKCDLSGELVHLCHPLGVRPGNPHMARVAALYNPCAQLGSIPPAWALCVITPIHKRGPVYARWQKGDTQHSGVCVKTATEGHSEVHRDVWLTRGCLGGMPIAMPVIGLSDSELSDRLPFLPNRQTIRSDYGAGESDV